MRWLRQWGPAVAWAAVIWTFSTRYFSASATSRFLLPLFHWLLPHASHQTLKTMHFLTRKSAHFLEYFIFSLLVLRGLRGTGRPRAVAWPLVAIATAAGYGSLDELHQAFVPGRTASGWDVLLDSSGAIAAQLLAWVYAWHQSRSLETPA
ncbi:MAG TPA: VanZ family protein [Candidatus Acidoferrales bacterium]|nr:VanZ family protein [Candidatus Acidoferrales bacterium]